MPHLQAYVSSSLTAIFGMGTFPYPAVCDMAYDEFSAWCAYLSHHEFHREDAVAQKQHDADMAAAALAARS